MSLWIVLVGAALCGAVVPALGAARSVPVRFVVHTPESTPPGDALYIPGNVPELGPWDPGKVALERAGERAHRITLDLPAGTAFEFKITRGGWETVEKGPHGEEIANRQLLVPQSADTLQVEVRVATWRDQVQKEPQRAHTLTGDVRPLGKVHMLGNDRDVWAYLPPSYEKSPERRYPVIYFHDGQNVFDAATSFIGIEWGADETLERLIGAGAMQEAIAVAVANSPRRMQEYTQVTDAEHGAGGEADRYLQFLVQELKPRIDSRFRTLPDREHTALVGSSLGGLVSLYAGVAAWETFGLVGGVSPVLYWGDHDLEKRWRAAPAEHLPLRVWIDMGTAEHLSSGDHLILELRRFRDVLVQRGYRPADSSPGARPGAPGSLVFGYLEAQGAVHNEAAWAGRLPDILMFLLPAR